MKRFCLLLLLISLTVPKPTFAQSLSEKLTAEPLSQLAEEARRFGDPQRGALAFYQPTMNCARCHQQPVSQAAGSQRRLGPDLAERREAKFEYLAEAVLHPSAEIKQGFETTLFQLVDGRQMSGIVIAQTDSHFTVDQIEQPDKPLQLAKTEIEEWQLTKKSIMPDALVNQLGDRQQFLDLISYLAEIAIGGPTRAAELEPANALAMLPLPEYESHIDHAALIRDLDDEALQRGAATFRLQCESCHGTADQEGSMPTSLRFVSGQFKNGNDPYRMYQTLTQGFGMMNSQRWMVPRQKYEVIHFIRQQFLKQKNPTQFVDITQAYLDGLPAGDTPGPDPVEVHPWTLMDYGPSMISSIEVSRDGSNIAQKGIVVRLDDGPGGVESGSHWMMYEHDTMRLAGAWTGGFIDYEGIQFNGAHGCHPKVVGDVQFSNPTGPGWGHPDNASFVDNRLVGRDNKRYGPLDRKWAHYKGMFRFGRQTIIQYTVGDTNVLESPGLTFIDDHPVYTRTLNLGPRSQELVLQIASLPTGRFQKLDKSMSALVTVAKTKQPSDKGLLATVSSNVQSPQWVFADDCLRLKIPAGDALQFVVAQCPLADSELADDFPAQVQAQLHWQDLSLLTHGGPANYPQKLTTDLIRDVQLGSNEDAKQSADIQPGPFAVDILARPKSNPWNCQLRLTGLDFLPGGNSMVVATWDGAIWQVSGFNEEQSSAGLTWQRIAVGLFQPLGIKWIDGKIYVTCRDQLAVLHDLNGDGEMDWYQSLNSDHQVTEHFHEFAMGLQTDDEGNFYYAKSARHALPALVPHHGTLLKISADGERTKILANGFRAANGVCLNPDGSFVVTDQEGHWNPKNRINWVKPGGFYGNMFGYHDVTDQSDSAMDQPLCWITNSFDRSPSELLWVNSKKWGPLNGSLLNFSYGYGQVYVVPFEKVNGQMQGGMCAFPLPRFPTGVMRGRFSPTDGQLYCCGMYAWAGEQTQPGGLYRIRFTGQPVYLPVGLHAKTDGLEIQFSGELNSAAVKDVLNFAITTWALKRTKDYGSQHYNEKRLVVEKAELLPDGKSVKLTIPDIQPTWCMEINYSLITAAGEKLRGKIHNTIHHLTE